MNKERKRERETAAKNDFMRRRDRKGKKTYTNQATRGGTEMSMSN